ncbi:mycofactocin biosynthesis glycosyltransferase MftF [Gordonia sp. (in: high G+C Gram-positive bacteria)]|uniref:mycofactocin biosynthesis glycosyltransferase MftF n=1 Tax=Gordonia sp. (in: high G+C Gram-positive bacteria) TaxID=84139 RepID=UPI0039E21EF1
MTRETELPSGFQVQIDPTCDVDGDWRRLIGGSPTRLLTVSDRAAAMIDDDGRITVRDDGTRSLARTLLDRGVAHPRPMSGPRADEVTVVVPVRDNQAGLDRLLESLRGLNVIVVDDGSAVPLAVPDGVRLERLETNRGPAAARNRGAALADTEIVVFLDSDVVPLVEGAAARGGCGDWLAALLGHFSDPAVGLAAPRIVGLPTRNTGPIGRYEAAASSLDMGARESAVTPGGRVPYVPSAAMAVRRSAFPGFDEGLRVAEDVDLCWRMSADGWQLRYDPIARVAHDHRTALSAMLDRRRFYGTGAAFLAERHGRAAAPLAMGGSIALALAALLTRTRLGLVVAAVALGVAGWRLRARLAALPDRNRVAVRLTAQAAGNGLLQTGSAVTRHYWPIAVLGALASRRLRRLFVRIALADAAVAWVRLARAEHRIPRIDPLSFFVLRRLDDLAYGTGLWQGALTRRDPTALLPVFTR